MNDQLMIDITAKKYIDIADTEEKTRVAIEEFSLALQKLSDKYQIEISPMIIFRGVPLKKKG